MRARFRRAFIFLFAVAALWFRWTPATAESADVRPRSGVPADRLAPSATPAPGAEIAGTLTAHEIFRFAAAWSNGSRAADVLSDGTIDGGDVLELARVLVTSGVETLAEPLPRPQWTHPSIDDMYATFYTFDASENDHFLDWSDVPGAGAYEVIADVTREFGGPGQVSWAVAATTTPGIPASNSRMMHVSTGDDMFGVRVRALGVEPTPVPGELSDARIFTLSRKLVPTPTPTPTIGPTADIDLNGDGAADGVDMIAFQSAWRTEEGIDANFLTGAAVLAEPTDAVDASDLLAFDREYVRRRVPMPGPVLVAPASGSIFSPADFDEGSVTFQWTAPPATYGRVAYQFRLRGPLTEDPPTEYPPIYTEETSLTTRFSLGTDPGEPKTPYEWWVVVFSPYGIKEPSASARSIFYLQ